MIKERVIIIIEKIVRNLVNFDELGYFKVF